MSLGRRDDGRLAWPTSSCSSTRRARTSSSCASRAATPSNRQVAPTTAPRPGRGGAAPGRGGRDARHDHHRQPGRVPRRARQPDGEGRVLRDRRRPVRGGHRPRRPRRQRDQAGQRDQGDGRPAPGPGRGDPGRAAWRRATARRSAPATRSSSWTPWPRRAPNLVAGANRPGYHLRNINVAARLHARRRRRHRQRPRGRRLPRLRRARDPAQRHRGRQHLQARDEVHEGARAPSTWARTASATRSSWARTASASGATSPASSRPTTTSKGIVWPAEVAPYPAHLVALGANKDPEVTEIAERLHDLAAAAGPATRSCTTIATSRRASSSPTRTCSGMPWILTVSPRSLEAGGDRGQEPRDRREGGPRRSRTSRPSWPGRAATPV